jgi:hypothetical protein
MSLDFDFTGMIDRVGRKEFDRITDHPNPDNKSWHPITEGLIWMTLSVGLPGIHTKYVDKFVERAAALQAVQGGWLATSDGKILITEEDIRAHEGMRTNVSFENDAKFYAKLTKIAIEEGRRQANLQGASAFDRVAAMAAEHAAAQTEETST